MSLAAMIRHKTVMMTALCWVIQSQPGQQLVRALAQGEVDAYRDAHAEGADDGEHHVGEGLLCAGDAGLGDRRGAAGGQQQVLGVGAGQGSSQAERAQRGGLVDRGHPLGHLRLIAAVGTAAELADRDQEQQDAETDLDPAHPRGRGTGLARPARPGQGQEDGSDDAQAGQPAQDERGPVDPGPVAGEHEDCRDDRDRAERDPDRQRQRSSDGLPHHSSCARGTERPGPVLAQFRECQPGGRGCCDGSVTHEGHA
jgi:hypothetical protein